MIQKDRWMDEITDKLKRKFGMRLLFAGLQGSYRRGEATEVSDFDVVVVLDELTINDLKEYRRLLKIIPEHEKACGFIGGREELQNWTKHELFQFSQDTDSYYGSLEPLLPAWDETDILRSLKISAANLYHAACHLYLFGTPGTRTADLKSLYKAVFFPLQFAEYLRTERYCLTKPHDPFSRNAVLTKLRTAKQNGTAALCHPLHLFKRQQEKSYMLWPFRLKCGTIIPL